MCQPSSLFGSLTLDFGSYFWRSTMHTHIGLLMIQIFATGCTVFGVRTVEEPAYKVISHEKNKEIREYEPSIVATTSVNGDYKNAHNEGFRILAAYIFGQNKTNIDIAMTAPVTQEPTSESIAMTAPVTQTEQDGNWIMSFTMPSKFQTIKDLPTPIDDRVVLSKLPGGTYASISYTWFADFNKNKEMAKNLLEWLDKNPEYEAVSKPFYAGYNPPWTLPFLRHNEMIVRIKRVEKSKETMNVK